MKLFKELRVALLPDGLDPADLVQQRGATALAAAVKSSVSLSAFFLSAAGATSADKAKALEEVGEILAALDDEAYREIEIAATSHRFGVPEEVVRRLVKGHRVQAETRASNAARGGHAGTSAGMGTDRIRGAGAHAVSIPLPPEQPSEVPLPRTERWAIESILATPALLEDVRARGIDETWFQDARARTIFTTLLAGAPLAEIDESAARIAVADVVASIDKEKDYAREWRGIVACLQEGRRPSARTNGPDDELREVSVRKIRSMSLAHEKSARSGDTAEVNG
jgi:DNA primase